MVQQPAQRKTDRPWRWGRRRERFRNCRNVGVDIGFKMRGRQLGHGVAGTGEGSDVVPPGIAGA
jgi:hypothetical protein